MPEIGYNTALILMSAASLGIACGVIGYYAMLFRYSLISDSISHASLPGIAGGFLLALVCGLHDGRFLPFLLGGALMTCITSIFYVRWIESRKKLSQDTAIASSLALFFSIGIVLLSIIQNLDGGHKAGLNGFLLGQITGTGLSDTIIITAMSATLILSSIMLHRALLGASFDAHFLKLQNPPLQRSGHIGVLILLLLCITAGIKLVGSVLIIALLIMPAASARLLTPRPVPGIMLSGFFGSASTLTGAFISAHMSNAPAGPSMTLCAFAIFAFSFAFYTIKQRGATS